MGVGTRREQDKELPPSIYYVQSLIYSSTLGHRATSLIQRNKENPHQRQGGRLDLWGLYVHGALKTTRAPRDRAGYLPLVVTRWGDLRCPVPTVASVTAARPRPRRTAW